MNEQQLSAETLMRLSGQALLAFLGGAERLEARACPGFVLALTHEPVADLNYLLVSGGEAGAVRSFESAVAHCDESELPFVAMIGPDVIAALGPSCERLSLEHVVDWPLMVCPAGAAEEHALDGVQSRRVLTEADAQASCSVLAEAFEMPLDSTRRALPLASMVLPGLEVHVAECDGRVESSVTVTRHGEVAGIWAMGTRPEAQGRRIGKALLSRVMVEHRERGVTAFFLGATPAGRPLYERLGYREVAAAQVWVRGATSQS